MAIYHASTKSLSRSDGRSAVASAAYRAGVRLEDARTGLVHDYSRRHGVVSAEILLPDGGEAERSELWNAVEAAERRKDSRTGREWVLALPSELDAEQRHELARSFALELVRRYGVAVDLAIHEPSRAGDERNHHAHLFATTRAVSRTADGSLVLGEKVAPELSDTNRRKLGLNAASEEVAELRRVWERLANEALERAGHAERITAKSFEAQGIDREPTTHLGPSATAMERRKEPSERGEINRQAQARNAEREAVEAEIIDLRAEKARRDREAQERLERDAEAARQEAAQKAAREAQARKEAEEARRAKEARQEAERAAKERQETERRAAAERQAEKTRRAEAQKAERRRIEGLSARELAREIDRMEISTPQDLCKQDREVLRAEEAAQIMRGRVWHETHRERDAIKEAQEWRRKHPIRAWLHDREWRPSARLLAHQRQAEEARQDKDRLKPELEAAESVAELAVRRVHDRWMVAASYKRGLREILGRKQEAEAEQARQAAQEREAKRQAEQAKADEPHRLAVERGGEAFRSEVRRDPEAMRVYLLKTYLPHLMTHRQREAWGERMRELGEVVKEPEAPKEPSRPPAAKTEREAPQQPERSAPKRREPDRGFDRDW